jgi:chemotaxis protein CheD
MHERRRGGFDLDGVFVRPGELALAEDGSTLVSVAARGIVVCLWAPAPPMAGMAHVLEASTTDPRKATGRFANAAIPELARMVRSRGAVNLEAQLLGGAFRDDDEESAGKRLAKASMRILDRIGVPVVSSDLGGSKGRKVVFDGTSGQIAVVKVHELRREDWNP